jgi:hypothetical protein
MANPNNVPTPEEHLMPEAVTATGYLGEIAAQSMGGIPEYVPEYEQ